MRLVRLPPSAPGSATVQGPASAGVGPATARAADPSRDPGPLPPPPPARGAGPSAPAGLGARLAAAKDALLQLVSPGAVAAVVLGLSGCASTSTPSGGVRGAALGDVGGRQPPPMDQLAYPTAQLGKGRFTIESSGCLLTSLTMASSWFHGRADLDPPRANRLVLANDGFSGSALELERAAPALGLRIDRRAPVRAASAEVLNRELALSLDAGRPVVLGVDFQPGSSSQASAADHFILAFRTKTGGTCVAMDPAGGHLVELVPTGDGSLAYRGAQDRHITEMIFLDRAPFARDPAAVLEAR